MEIIGAFNYELLLSPTHKRGATILHLTLEFLSNRPIMNFTFSSHFKSLSIALAKREWTKISSSNGNFLSHFHICSYSSN